MYVIKSPPLFTMASDPAKEALPAEKEEDLDFSGKFPISLNEVVPLPAGCP